MEFLASERLTLFARSGAEAHGHVLFSDWSHTERFSTRIYVVTYFTVQIAHLSSQALMIRDWLMQCRAYVAIARG